MLGEVVVERMKFMFKTKSTSTKESKICELKINVAHHCQGRESLSNMKICDQSISNDLDATIWGSLKLIWVLNQVDVLTSMLHTTSRL